MLFFMAQTENLFIFEKYKGRELEYECKCKCKCRERGYFKIKGCLHNENER